MVSTANGKITREDDPTIYRWTSDEDKRHFEGMIATHDLIVMGSATYEAAKKVIRPVPGKKRIVLTRHPENYTQASIPGQLEFRNVNAEALVTECAGAGYNAMLLAGGGNVNAQFFAAGLVDELYLTIEPVLFGQGKGIVDDTLAHANLRLRECTRLNERGTLLLHYDVEKNQ
jgi:dihydrofolate reductase